MFKPRGHGQIKNCKQQCCLQLPSTSSGTDGEQLELSGITDLSWCWYGREPCHWTIQTLDKELRLGSKWLNVNWQLPSAIITAVAAATAASKMLQTSSLFNWAVFTFFKVVLWPFLDTGSSYDRKQDEREGEWQTANRPQAGIRTQGCCSTDKASVHWTPTLPTELNSTQNSFHFYNIYIHYRSEVLEHPNFQFF